MTATAREPDPDPADERLWRMLKALGHPVRLQILRCIADHPGCVCTEILYSLPDSCCRAQSTLSQHLKILRDADLIEGDGEGHITYYTVNQQALDWLREQL
ncbi:MAG: metalloregulator ArsR/SmtB family transcription factor [Roseiflexaceae bacterium]